ncbi:MAG: hypothetical protein H7039_05485 [Bryobacteraceae bacterium]|nr:hypothetical protein [Bryobacteraceae bacterium]
MKNSDQIESALKLLREENGRQQAPHSVEIRLRAAFQEKHAQPWYRSLHWPLRIAAFASAALLCVALYSWQTGTNRGDDKISAVVPPIQAESKPVRTVPKTAPPTIARTARKSRKPRLRPTPPPTPVMATARPAIEEFVAIPYAPPLTAHDRGEVIRVGLSRHSIRSLGIPTNPERFLERVPADLLVGEDGIPRGFRLIRTTEPR